MRSKKVYLFIKCIIVLVWLINGIYCKILNYVPRHQQIVGEILGNNFAEIFTKCIGFSEVVMAIWIFTGFKSKFNAICQIVIVLTMNVLEFTLVPHLLLWGKFNICFALIFCVVVYVNEFILKPKPNNV
jgi:uncharacterized membrane protein YphA (DoxX/SURF4 family)